MMDLICPKPPTFHLRQMLGEGLSSRIYRATRIDSEGHSRQEVALKILKSKNEVRWLRREFAALSAIHSPNCVRILGWENLPSGPALVLEWIDGVSLNRLMTRQEWDLSLIDELTNQVQSGLRAISAVGLCHGDLSPGNILIDRVGQVRLIDFGCAAPDQAPSVEQLGTPAYMAPETWQNQQRSLASDLFALGLIRYDLLHPALPPPWQGEQALLRAEKVQNTSTLLFSDPSQRQMMELSGSQEGRERLSQMVHEVMAETPRTQKLASLSAAYRINALPSLGWLRGWAVASALVLVLFVPNTSRSKISQDLSLPATLRVQSLNWVDVKMDGRELGYAPLWIRNISLGRHRLFWRTALGQGQLDIVFKASEEKVLSDAEFKTLSRAGRK